MSVITKIRIAVVGPCAAGKSTLVTALREAGYEARHVAQEHSYVPDMWRRVAGPDLLIYLDVDHAAALRRRPHMTGGERWQGEQGRRLAHARQHCDLYVDTTHLSQAEVYDEVMRFLQQWQTRQGGSGCQ